MRRETNAQKSGRGVWQPSRMIFKQPGTLQKLSITFQEKTLYPRALAPQMLSEGGMKKLRLMVKWKETTSSGGSHEGLSKARFVG